MSDLNQALQQQCEQLEKLLAMLDRELKLISGREPDELLRLVEEKNLLLDHIQQSDDTLATLFAQATNDGEGQVALSADDQALLDRCKALLEQCKYNTAINQKAVEQGQLKLSHLRQLIVDVRAKESLTYDKSGNTTGGSLGKGISA